MAGHDKETDHLTGTETTGHEWDGIKELNTPLPRWWLYVFYACIVWGVIYTVVMPAWPYIGPSGWSATKGTLSYTQRGTVVDDLKAQDASRADLFKQIESTDLNQIIAQPALLEASIAGGRIAFLENCAPCHGTGAQGGKGFPNLQDDDWLWGGTVNAIHQTIAHGVRWDNDADTRMSQMPAYGRDGLLEPRQISAVVEHVLKLSGQQHNARLAATGATIFGEQCAACHGVDGTGDKTQGAPNLTDKVWLFGGDRATITETVTNARYGVMPAWQERLQPAVVKQLALYVYSLGGGVREEQTAMAAPAEADAAVAAQ